MYRSFKIVFSKIFCLRSKPSQFCSRKKHVQSLYLFSFISGQSYCGRFGSTLTWRIFLNKNKSINKSYNNVINCFNKLYISQNMLHPNMHSITFKFFDMSDTVVFAYFFQSEGSLTVHIHHWILHRIKVSYITEAISLYCIIHSSLMWAITQISRTYVASVGPSLETSIFSLSFQIVQKPQ